jgi:hypothetical protein
VDGEVCSLLYGLHGAIFGRLDDDRPRATDPGEERRMVFIIVPPPGLAFLAAPTRSATQMSFPTLFRLVLLASGVREFIRFHVFAMHPQQLDRFRDRHSVAGAQDDRRDAFVLAASLRTDQPSVHRLQLDAPPL